MLVKLREERTVVLTTHHLDEAELLSDQLVIMHKVGSRSPTSDIDDMVHLI
jgi:ABC-type multidrug transport system ATPase subunit